MVSAEFTTAQVWIAMSNSRLGLASVKVALVSIHLGSLFGALSLVEVVVINPNKQPEVLKISLRSLNRSSLWGMKVKELLRPQAIVQEEELRARTCS